MVAVLWVARWYGRRRWAALLPFVLVLTAGLAGALVAVTTAARTDRAWDRYVARAEVGDLIVNPSIQTVEIGAVIRDLPGVTNVVTDDLLYAAVGRYSSVDDAIHAEAAFVRVGGSRDGRFVDSDRLALREGRAPTGTNEVALSATVADALGIELGDELPFTFASIADDVRAIYLDEQPTIGIIGHETPTVVGIATLPDEILPDDVYEQGRAILSPDIVARYACTPHEVGHGATMAELIDQLAPADCATSYRYWSLRLPPDDPGGGRTMQALIAGFAERNAARGPAMQQIGAGYVPIVTTTADTGARVERTMRPTVVALLAIGLATALLTICLAALALARSLQRDRSVRAVWRDIGLSRSQVTAVLSIAVAVACVIACIAAAVIASLVPTRPAGAVRVLEQARTGLDDWAWIVLALSTVVVTATALAVAAGASRSLARPTTTGSIAPRATVLGAVVAPDIAIGAREAVPWQRSTVFTWLASMLGFAALTATLVFGTSLSHLVASPTAYGWPWDLADMIGSGYGGAGLETVAPVLDEDDRIVGWSALGLAQGIAVDGQDLTAIIDYDTPTASDVVVSNGRLPVAADEIALGARTAAGLSVGIGDEVTLRGEGLRVDRARVTGIVVLPSIGPYQADAATPGRGALLPDDAFETEVAASLFTFVGIDVADGASVAELTADLEPHFWSWEVYDQPRPLTAPVRPPEIVNSDSIRSVPLLVAVLVGSGIVIGFVAAMYFSARARRHELAILRTLGFTNRQLRRSLSVQSVVTAVTTCGAGAVLGVVVGRWTWRAFADSLGVLPGSRVSLAVTALVVLAAVLLGVLASIAPGRLATRLRVDAALRRG
jgi:ABC-type lipoprotein release transport system permease subunit